MSRFFIVPRNLAIAFYAAWETGSKIEMLGGMEPFIVESYLYHPRTPPAGRHPVTR
jgi:hypothetical protein